VFYDFSLAALHYPGPGVEKNIGLIFSHTPTCLNNCQKIFVEGRKQKRKHLCCLEANLQTKFVLEGWVLVTHTCNPSYLGV
jgi:hypothetical protein